MAKVIKIKKGLSIPLYGPAEGAPVADTATAVYGIVPDDFPGYIWKAAVKEGDAVLAGSPLFVAKDTPELQLTSPVSGTVKEIHRGERRKIEYISVESNGKNEAHQFEITKLSALQVLKNSGLYAAMRQRPFDIVPISDTPRDIFVTAFDTAPLAPEMITPDTKEYLEKGLEVLSKLTEGKVYLSVPEGSDINSKYAEVVKFNTLHPAGNVGTQIAAIAPVNKGETVWTLDAQAAAKIGKLFATGNVDYSVEVAVTGEGVKDPCFVNTIAGASLSTLLDGKLKEGHQRVISGNVLTGWREDVKRGFLRFPYRQITVIPEGDDADEFMGWASMNPKKYSVKHTFPAFLRGLSKPFNFDARVKGGHRAMIMSGEYDKVFPMDIYPEYLIKAILAKDIEKMEQLGIYEVAPEDFALPEFVDTSKLELQKIVRDGLDYLRKETL